MKIRNFKNKESQMNFKTMTSETSNFTNCLKNQLSLEKQIENCRKLLNKNIKENFKKVRISKRHKNKNHYLEINKLIEERNIIKHTDGHHRDENSIQEKESLIADGEAKIKINKILENFKTFSSNPENINLQQVWKVLNRLWPKVQSKLLTAKKNHNGVLISETNQIKQLLAREYKERLRERPIRPDLDNLEKRRKKNISTQIKVCQ